MVRWKLAVFIVVVGALLGGLRVVPAQHPHAAAGATAGPTEPAAVPPRAGVPPGDDAMVLLARPKSYSAGRVSSFARNGGNLDTVRIPAGGEEITLADIKGPGAISHIWNTFRGHGRDLIIRIYWEGNAAPSVEAPIGDFFGVAMGMDAPINAFPIQVSSGGRARNCWWHMPFNKAARVTVTNVMPAPARDIELYYYIDYQLYGSPIKDITYFHARFRETDPTEPGKPVRLVEVKGSGHFVGVVMGHRARTPGWFGEGDDIITVDGRVAFVGTGTEDYFSDAWGFRIFSDLYHGVPVYEGEKVGDRLSAYRFHIQDPIPFEKSFVFDIEHWPWAAAQANSGREYYSSVGFWYQRTLHEPWPRLVALISNDAWDPAKGRWHVPGALEAEDLGILGYHSTAPVDASPVVAGEGSSRDVLRSMLRYSGKPTPVFYMPFLSGDYMLGFDAGPAGHGDFSVALPAPAEGVYTLKVHYVRADDYGIVQLHVNGDRVGEPIDTFLKTKELTRPIWAPDAVEFSGVHLREGLNTLRFAIDAKNPASGGYRMGIDCVQIKPAAASSER